MQTQITQRGMKVMPVVHPESNKRPTYKNRQVIN
jgi:hypothetical protein